MIHPGDGHGKRVPGSTHTLPVSPSSAAKLVDVGAVSVRSLTGAHLGA